MTLKDQFRFLIGYFWVADRSDLRWRLIGALVCLFLAKSSNLATPWLLGQTVDTLDRNEVMDVMASWRSRFGVCLCVQSFGRACFF